MKKSILDPIQRTLPPLLESSNQNSIRRAKESAEGTNRARIKSYEFKIGQKVYKKSNEPGKLATPWDGPYMITQLDKNCNRIEIEKAGRTLTVNIKQIRPL